MATIKKLAGCVYFEGNFKMRDENVNWATPVDFPTIFTAVGRAIRSGNWSSCTGTNTPEYIHKFYSENVKKVDSNYEIPLPTLTENEKYELFGLWDAIATMSKAHGVAKHGNHGTDKSEDITDGDVATAIHKMLVKMVDRINVLYSKLPFL